MTYFRQLLPIKYFIFIISLHLLLKGAKQEVSQTISVECFALQVVTGKQKTTTCVKSRNWHQESDRFWKA